MQSYSFRELCESDLAWFVELRNSVREMLHNPSSFTLQDALDWFPNSEGTYWVIELDGQLVGYFRIINTEVNRVLIGADIHPSYQGRGIGAKVYPIFVQEILLPLGVTNLELRVLKKNKVALGLYKKLGFNIVDETSRDFHMHINVDRLLASDG